MSFHIYWFNRKGQEMHIRVDAANEQEARSNFTQRHPTRKISQVKDVTQYVRSGIASW
jgi:hypothetical protein